jgi:Ni/Fe-hydrogenase subunit HybB-like protein
MAGVCVARAPRDKRKFPKGMPWERSEGLLSMTESEHIATMRIPSLAARGEAHRPSEERLERFMRGMLPRAEVAAIVRHLLTGCPFCLVVTRELWPPEALTVTPVRTALARPWGAIRFPMRSVRRSRV